MSSAGPSDPPDPSTAFVEGTDPAAPPSVSGTPDSGTPDSRTPDSSPPDSSPPAPPAPVYPPPAAFGPVPASLPSEPYTPPSHPAPPEYTPPAPPRHADPVPPEQPGQPQAAGVFGGGQPDPGYPPIPVYGAPPAPTGFTPPTSFTPPMPPPSFDSAGYAQPGYPAQPGYAAPPGYGPQPGYPAQPGYGTPSNYAQSPAAYPGQGAAPLAGYVPGNASVGATGRGFGYAGGITALIGVAAIVVCFTALNWITASGAGVHYNAKFSNLHDLVRDSHNDAPKIATWYFSWLGWLLLVAVAVLALVAVLPTPAHGLFRGLGFVVGVGGGVITFFALKSGGTSLSDLLKHGAVGFWVAIAGFVIAGIGAAMGPRHVRS